MNFIYGFFEVANFSLVFACPDSINLIGSVVRLWMQRIEVSWFSCWCKYLGHSVVGRSAMVFGGIVRIMCTPL